MKVLIICLFGFIFLRNIDAQVEITDLGMTITKVEKTKKKTLLRAVDRSSDALNFFHDYYYPTSLSSYEKLFVNGEFYGLTQDDYVSWQKYIQSIDIEIDYIYYATIEGTEYAIFPYKTSFGNYFQRNVDLAKKINGKWWSVTGEEDLRLAKVSHLFNMVTPKLIQLLFTPSKLKPDSYIEKDNLNNLSYTLRELSDARSDAYLRPGTASRGNSTSDLYHSSMEWSKQGMKTFNKTVAPELAIWLADLQLTEGQINEVIHYLTLGEQGKALQKIDEYYDQSLGYKTQQDFVNSMKNIFAKLVNEK